MKSRDAMRFMLNCLVMLIMINSGVAFGHPNNQSKMIKPLMNRIFSSSDEVTLIKPESLPAPSRYMLSQTLITPAIEQCYQRSAVIQPLYTEQNNRANTFSRSVLMYVDTNKKRNNPRLAIQLRQARPVELAFIVMNFNELPERIKHAVQSSDVPFGKLLLSHHIKVRAKGRAYFSIACDKNMSSLIHCDLNNKLYGRKNTLINADSNKWLAQVVEILPNHEGMDVICK